MAKKKAQSENIRYAVNKKALKNARAQAALEQADLEKRMANREKSRRMSTAFLFGVFSLIGAFCLYVLLRTLLLRPAASLEDLRANLLFVSIVAIPYLLGFCAVLIHRLLKKRRENWSDRSKRLSGIALALALFAAFFLFGIQFRGGRRSASSLPSYNSTLAALQQSGLAVWEPDAAESVRTLLEESLCTDLGCGQTQLRLNWHADGSGSIARRFLEQAAADYGAYPLTETAGVKLWGPQGTDAVARAAIAAQAGNEICIVELLGPRAELDALLPLLTAEADSATP